MSKKRIKIKKNEDKKILTWPNTYKQWFKLIIGVIGLVIIFFITANWIEINTGATIVTLIGFIGYIIDGLIDNIEERKKHSKRK